MLLPFRVSVNPITRYVPITRDVFEAIALGLIANLIAFE